MTKDLMIPRYEVIALYPNSNLTIGEVFEIDEQDTWSRIFGVTCKQYPNIYRRLSWWEKRKPKDMPEYLGYSPFITLDNDRTEFNGTYEDVVRVKKHHFKSQDIFLTESGDSVYYHVWYPATEEQFKLITDSSFKIKT